MQIVKQGYVTRQTIALCLVVAVCIIVIYSFLVKQRYRTTDKNGTKASFAEGLTIAFALITLGYLCTYFVFEGNVRQEMPFTGRISRVNIAGLFGHSLLL